MNIEKVDQPKLAQHDATLLDLAFCMDCTGSMASYIENARNSIRTIVEEIVASEKSDVRLALVEYRDHPPQESTFVTKTHDFTSSIKDMKNWLDACSANGGGDTPEAVADGLQEILKLSWREKSTKICVLISDAPPHGLTKNDKQCPCKIDPIEVVDQMGRKGITLYSVGCEPAILPYKDFFQAIAFKTGGQYVPLRNASLLAKVIIGGTQEEISLEKLMEDVQQEVQQQMAHGIVDEEMLSAVVHEKLVKKNARSKNLKFNNQRLEIASERAMNYSKMANLSDVQSDYLKSEHLEHAMYDLADASASFESKSKKKSFLSSMFSRSSKSNALPAMSTKSSAVNAFETIKPSEDLYEVTEEVVHKEQTDRLVKKALNRNKK